MEDKDQNLENNNGQDIKTIEIENILKEYNVYNNGIKVFDKEGWTLSGQSDIGNREVSSTKYIDVEKYWNFPGTTNPKIDVEFLTGVTYRNDGTPILDWTNVNINNSYKTNNNNYIVSANITDKGFKELELVLYDRSFTSVQRLINAAVSTSNNLMQKNSSDKNKELEKKKITAYEATVENGLSLQFFSSPGDISTNIRVSYGYNENKNTEVPKTYSGLLDSKKTSESDQLYNRWKYSRPEEIPDPNKDIKTDINIDEDTVLLEQEQQATLFSEWKYFYITGLSTTLTETGIKYNIKAVSSETFALNGYKMFQQYSKLVGKPKTVLATLMNMFNQKGSPIRLLWADDEIPATSSTINGMDILMDYETGKFVKVDENEAENVYDKINTPIRDLKKYIEMLRDMEACFVNMPKNTISSNCNDMEIEYSKFIKNIEEFDNLNELKSSKKTFIDLATWPIVNFGDMELNNPEFGNSLFYISSYLNLLSQSYYPLKDALNNKNSGGDFKTKFYIKDLMKTWLGCIAISAYENNNIKENGLGQYTEAWKNREILLEKYNKVREIIGNKYNEIFKYDNILPMWSYINNSSEEKIENDFLIGGKYVTEQANQVENKSSNYASGYSTNPNDWNEGEYTSRHEQTENANYAATKLYENMVAKGPNFSKNINDLSYEDIFDEENEKFDKKYLEKKVSNLNYQMTRLDPNFENIKLDTLESELSKKYYKNVSILNPISNSFLETYGWITFSNISYKCINPISMMSEKLEIYFSDIIDTKDNIYDIDSLKKYYNTIENLFKYLNDKEAYFTGVINNYFKRYININNMTEFVFYIYNKNDTFTPKEFIYKRDNGLYDSYFPLKNNKSKIELIKEEGSYIIQLSSEESDFIIRSPSILNSVLSDEKVEMDFEKYKVVIKDLILFCIQMEIDAANLNSTRKIGDVKDVYLPNDAELNPDKESTVTEYKEMLEKIRKNVNKNVLEKDQLSISGEDNTYRKLCENKKMAEIKYIEELGSIEDEKFLSTILSKSINDITKQKEGNKKEFEIGKRKGEGGSNKMVEEFGTHNFNINGKFSSDHLKGLSWNSNLLDNAFMLIENYEWASKADVYAFLDCIDEKIEELSETLNNLENQKTKLDESNIGKEIELSLGSQESRNQSLYLTKSISSLLNDFCTQCQPKVRDRDLDIKNENIIQIKDESGEDKVVDVYEDMPKYNLTWGIIGTCGSAPIIGLYYKEPKKSKIMRIYRWGTGNPKAHCIKALSIASNNEFAMLHNFNTITKGENGSKIEYKTSDKNKKYTINNFMPGKTPCFFVNSFDNTRDENIFNNSKNNIYKGSMVILGDPSLIFKGTMQPYTYPIYLDIQLQSENRNWSYDGKDGNIDSVMSGYYMITSITHNISSAGYTTTLEVMKYPGSGDSVV